MIFSSYILPAILVAAAAIMKAVADTLAWHFDTSIFSSMRNRDFWEVNTARRRNVRTVASYPLDGWHIANSVKLICWLAGMYLVTTKPVIHPLADMATAAIWFVLVFNLFWNKILLK